MTSLSTPLLIMVAGVNAGTKSRFLASSNVRVAENKTESVNKTQNASSVLLGSAVASGCANWCADSPATTWQWTPDCQGCDWSVAAANGCADWCHDSPSYTWQWTPSCEGCMGQASSALLSSQQNPVTEQGISSGDKTKSTDDVLVASSVAAGCATWCANSPATTWQWTPDCKGCDWSVAASNGCAEWCANSPSYTWQWTPSCEGCIGQSSVELGAAATDKAPDSGDESLIASSAKPGCASWCASSPAMTWQYMSACTGCDWSVAAANGCADWCANSPSYTWQYTPACEGCIDRAPIYP